MERLSMFGTKSHIFIKNIKRMKMNIFSLHSHISLLKRRLLFGFVRMAEKTESSVLLLL